jgi:transcriptional regulator with XRE-family HTH domain
VADLNAHYRIVLTNEYKKRVMKNKKYSKNSFARLLGIDGTYLSKLLSGKILLSLDIAEKVTKRLQLDKKGRIDFLLSAAEEQRCHALYLIDPTLTDCDSALHKINLQPVSRKK